MSAYDRLWNRTAKYFGAEGLPAPATTPYVPQQADYLNKPAYAVTSWGPQGRAVQSSPKLERHLSTTAKGIKSNSARARTIKARRRQAMESIIHEWAHVYQPTETLEGDALAKEQLANAFASKVAADLWKSQPSPVLLRDLRRTYGPGYIMRGQFGSNYGADPTTIR